MAARRRAGLERQLPAGIEHQREPQPPLGLRDVQLPSRQPFVQIPEPPREDSGRPAPHDRGDVVGIRDADQGGQHRQVDALGIQREPEVLFEDVERAGARSGRGHPAVGVSADRPAQRFSRTHLDQTGALGGTGNSTSTVEVSPSAGGRESPILVTPFSEGLRPSDSPARSLARRFAGALRSRGSLAALVRSRGLRPSARLRDCFGDVRRSLGEGGTPLHRRSLGAKAGARLFRGADREAGLAGARQVLRDRLGAGMHLQLLVIRRT